MAFSPGETRTIILLYEDRNIGKVIRANASDRERTVTLEPCATVKGQLLDQDGDPIVGVRIRVDVLPGGDFGKQLESMTTDADGRFQHTSIVPGADYSLYAEGPKIGFKAVARKVSLPAGQQLDLGTLQLKGDEFVQQETATLKTGSDSSKPKKPMATFSDFPAVAAVSPRDDVNGRTTIHVQGRVVDSNGVPVNGATVRVSADRPKQVASQRDDRRRRQVRDRFRQNAIHPTALALRTMAARSCLRNGSWLRNHLDHRRGAGKRLVARIEACARRRADRRASLRSRRTASPQCGAHNLEHRRAA